MKKIDPNYLNDEKYIPYRELSDQEREKMLARYEELYPYYESKAEVIDARGFCPMDILHEIVLTEKKQAWATERTMKTQAIREREKQEEYLYWLDSSEEQSDFSVLSYIQKHEQELKRVFKVLTM